jgi:exosortase E/protease (VPEID-CTERM system)
MSGPRPDRHNHYNRTTPCDRPGVADTMAAIRVAGFINVARSLRERVTLGPTSRGSTSVAPAATDSRSESATLGSLHHMSAGPADIDLQPGRLPVVRWVLLVLLLLAEAFALSAGYDAAHRGADAGWAGPVVAWTPAVFRWAVVAGGLAVVLGFMFLRHELHAALRRSYPPGAMILAVASQLAAYGLFALATDRTLGKDEPLEPWELIVWLAAGGLTVVTWALAMLPPRAWPDIVWRGRSVWLLAALIAALASLVARLARDEWDVLSEPTMRASYGLLKMILPDVVYDSQTRLLGTPKFRVEVGVPCSGYEGIGLMTVYLIVYLALFRHELRFPRAYVLIPVALAAVWCANVLRLVALVWIGDRVSPTLAVGGFHSQAGWVGFNAVALALLVWAHRSRLFTRSTINQSKGSGATAAYLVPLLAAVAVQMLVAALSTDPDALYPVRVATVGVLLACFWPRYTVLRTPGVVSPLAGWLWAVAVGVGVFAIWSVLVPPDKIDTEAASRPWWWVAFRVAGFEVVTPLAEELAFRGYLMRRLVAADFESVRPGRFTWPSFLVTGVLFGLMHGEWLAGIVAGLAYGLVVIRTGRVRDAVVAHAITNGLLFVAAARGT